METYLVQLIDVVHRKRCLIERECEVLRDLLKPWIVKKKVHIPADVAHQNDTSVLTNAGDEGSHSLSPAESQALKQVDQLLAKAERARQHKAKIDNEPRKTVGKTQGCSVVSQWSEDQRQNDKTRQQALQSKSTNSLSQPKLSDKKTKPDSKSYQNKRSEPNRDSHSATSKRSATRPLSSLASHRPPSRSQGTPVHMNAPFKTEATVKMPQRRAQQAAKNQTKMSKPGPGLRSNMSVYKSLPKIHSKPTSMKSSPKEMKPETEKPRSVEKSVMNDEVEPSRSPRPLENVEVPPHQADSVNVCDTNHNALPNESSAPLSRTETVQQIEADITCQTQDGLVEVDEKEVLDLKKDGSNLKIPGKLRKLYCTNSTLRDRCRSSRIIKKVSSGDPAETFVARLEAAAVIGPELKARVAARLCLARHQMLLEAFNSLNLEGLSDKSRVEEVYRSKVILEFILSEFASLEEEAAYLSRVHFKHVDLKDENPNPAPNHPSMQWFQPSVQGKSSHRLTENSALSSSEDWLCKETLNSDSRWQHLRFTEQYLQLQIQLVEMVEKEWDQWLLSGERDPSSLQLLYGLMTTCGQGFPAFVDSLEDTTDS